MKGDMGRSGSASIILWSQGPRVPCSETAPGLEKNKCHDNLSMERWPSVLIIFTIAVEHLNSRKQAQSSTVIALNTFGMTEENN